MTTLQGAHRIALNVRSTAGIILCMPGVHIAAAAAVIALAPSTSKLVARTQPATTFPPIQYRGTGAPPAGVTHPKSECPGMSQLSASTANSRNPVKRCPRGSFWFWRAQLQFPPPDQDPVVTGYAVSMRFRSMAAAHVDRGPVNGTPFTPSVSMVAALAGQYEEDLALTVGDALATDASPGL